MLYFLKLSMVVLDYLLFISHGSVVASLKIVLVGI